MDFEKYQGLARATAIYPAKHKIMYPALGLAGEAGEVCEKIKKVFRDKDGDFTSKDKEAIKKEVGDVLWYLVSVCEDMGFTLNEAAEKNIEKLYDRKSRGTLKGSGDDR